MKGKEKAGREVQTAPLQTEEVEPAFVFIGEALALDLINTEIMERGKPRDFLVSPDDVARWWKTATHYYPTMPRIKGEIPVESLQIEPALFDAIKSLRSTLRRLFMGLIEQGIADRDALAELNEVLASGSQALEVDERGILVQVYQAKDPELNGILLPVALSALSLLTEKERGRLHKCSNNRCIALFYDTTRSATRHWCSPGCMNRARSIQHYQRTKTA
ncbi:MAG TPA: ABATE domain-containing protein [Chloroflexia bacterium]|nr:ABATE domain-containing protein [Chloroflexia bacterium]